MQSGQIQTLSGPSMKVSAWLEERPQKLQMILAFLLSAFFVIIDFPLLSLQHPLL
jgi:hypothetical protein